MKPKQIVTVPHANFCCSREWMPPEYVLLSNRDSIGRRIHSSLLNPFLAFLCNDPDCPAQMIMPWHEVAAALHLNSEKEGKTR